MTSSLPAGGEEPNRERERETERETETETETERQIPIIMLA